MLRSGYAGSGEEDRRLYPQLRLRQPSRWFTRKKKRRREKARIEPRGEAARTPRALGNCHRIYNCCALSFFAPLYEERLSGVGSPSFRRSPPLSAKPLSATCSAGDMERDEKLIRGYSKSGGPCTYVSLRGGLTPTKKSLEGEARACTLFPSCSISCLSQDGARSFLCFRER